jgi:hypothetical protein
MQETDSKTYFGVHPASYPMGIKGSSPGVKQQEHKADQSPPINAEVNKTWIYKSTPSYAFME